MTMMLAQDYGRLSVADYGMMVTYLDPLNKYTIQPDVVIAPNGEPYLYRWHLTPHGMPGVYLHLQVKSDPERPLHDHPWDNTSTILSGGYDEVFALPGAGTPIYTYFRELRQGDYVSRKAEEAHRLILPPDIPYTITLFTHGPKRQEWGFWYPDGKHDYREHVAERDGKSVHINRGGEDGLPVRDH